MPNYKLNIKMNDEDLKTIYKADEKIILVKHTKNASSKKVAWVSFRPFKNNTIEWSTNFAIYSSNTEVQNGATINKLSDLAATSKVMYEFSQGVFQKPALASELGNSTYSIRNQMPDYDGLTFGLAQDVQVNGVGSAKNPISAVFVPYGQVVSMTPIERLDIYLKNDVDDGTVITHVSSIPLTIDYEENETEHTIAFSHSTGFYREN